MFVYLICEKIYIKEIFLCVDITCVVGYYSFEGGIISIRNYLVDRYLFIGRNVYKFGNVDEISCIIIWY